MYSDDFNDTITVMLYTSENKDFFIETSYTIYICMKSQEWLTLVLIFITQKIEIIKFQYL